MGGIRKGEVLGPRDRLHQHLPRVLRCACASQLSAHIRPGGAVPLSFHLAAAQLPLEPHLATTFAQIRHGARNRQPTDADLRAAAISVACKVPEKILTKSFTQNAIFCDSAWRISQRPTLSLQIPYAEFAIPLRYVDRLDTSNFVSKYADFAN